MPERMLAQALAVDIGMVRGWVQHGLPFTMERERTTGKIIKVIDREIFIDWCFVMNKLYISEWPEREAPFFIPSPRGQKQKLEKVMARAEEMLKGLPLSMTLRQCARHLGIGRSTILYWRDVHKLPTHLAPIKMRKHLVDKRSLIHWLLRGYHNPVLKREREKADAEQKRRANQATEGGDRPSSGQADRGAENP
jgi:hypothetical protein